MARRTKTAGKGKKDFKNFSQPQPPGGGWYGKTADTPRRRFAFAESSRAWSEIRRRAGGDCGYLAGDNGFGAKLASKGLRRFSIAQSSRVLDGIWRRTGGGGDFSQGGDGFGAEMARFARAPLAEGASWWKMGFGQSIALVAVTILVWRVGLASGLLNSVLHDGCHSGGYVAKLNNLTSLLKMPHAKSAKVAKGFFTRRTFADLAPLA